MRRATVFALLILAGTLSAGGPPAAYLSVLSVPSAQHICALRGWRSRMAEPDAVLEGRYWHDVCGSPLLHPDRGNYRHIGSAMSYSGATSVAGGMPGWKLAGAYTLEFTASAVGTLIAEAGGLTTVEGVYQAGWNGPGSVPGAAAFCLTSAVLSAGGTHLMGKLVGCGSTFRRALAGGAVGGLLGGAAFLNYFVTRRNPPSAMIPIGLILPPLCTVLAYNIGRSDGAK
jgi:hypothetical protein